MNNNEIRKAFEKITNIAEPQKVEKRIRNGISEHQHSHIKFVFPRRATVLVCIIIAAAISVSAYTVHRVITIRQLDTGKPYAYEIFVNLDENLIQLEDKVIEKLTPYNSNQVDADKRIGVYDVGKLFNTWEEAQAWLGCDLLSSNLFGNSSKNAPLCLLSNYSITDIVGVNIAGSLSITGTDYSVCNLSVSIPLSSDTDGYSFAESYNEPLIGWDKIYPYTTESGISCDIILTKRQDKRQTNYDASAYLFHEGAIYSFSIYEKDANTALDLMRQILDSLH